MTTADHDAVHYRAGNEHDPADPFGRCELMIGPGGGVHLRQVARTGTRAWTAQATEAALARLASALRLLTFPPPTTPAPRAGAVMRHLTVGSGASMRTATLEWHAALGLPGHGDLFTLLDAIVHQTSQGTIGSRTGGPDFVTGVQPA